MVGVTETENGFKGQVGQVVIELTYKEEYKELVFSELKTNEKFEPIGGGKILEEHEIRIVDSDLSSTGKDIVVIQGVNEYLFRMEYTDNTEYDCYTLMGWAADYAYKKLDRYVLASVQRIQREQIDELIDQIKDVAHEMLKQAYESGAISEGTWLSNPDNCVMAKIIVTLAGRKELFAPRHPDAIKELNNLKHFI